MVCKDDVLTWFRDLSGHKRIDLMCSLLDKCLPMELRFFGTCLEELGKQHFNAMKDFEVKANNPTELSELLVQCIISDTRTRQKLALYICLVHSLNTTCSNNLYKTLSNLDINRILPITNTSDEKLLEELLLIYTIAVNHPVFTFEQKATLGNILLTLRQAEDDYQAANEQLCDDYAALNLSGAGVNTDSVEPVVCSEVSQPMPSGLSYTVRIGNPGGNYIPLPTMPPFPPPVQQMPPSLVGIWPYSIETIVQDGTVPMVPPPHFSSPHISRQSSPSQSASPSRTASPVRKNMYKQRQGQMDGQYHINAPKLNNYETKEVGTKPEEELRGLSEAKVTDLAIDDIQQIRSNIVNINGIIDLDHRGMPPPPIPIVRNNPGFENEVTYPPVLPHPLDPSVISTQPPSIIPVKPCCVSTLGSGYPPAYCQHSLQGLSLDSEGCRHYSSSSNSDTSSTSHSPPSTPVNPNHIWDKGNVETDKIIRGTTDNINSHIEDSNLATQRNRMLPSIRGVGRTRGVQTLPRGRGPHSNITIDNNQKQIPNIRRDGPRSAPPTPQEDKKCYILPPADITPVVTSPSSMPLPLSTNPPPPPATTPKPTPPPPPSNHELVTSGVPYTPPFLTPHYSSIYPPYHHAAAAAFVRSNFPFTNGDVIYPYQPPQSFVPQMVPYCPNVPPPKIACYNCGSSSHLPTDCKEPTMEEYSSKGQYRIDYKPNTSKQQGEYLSDK